MKPGTWAVRDSVSDMTCGNRPLASCKRDTSMRKFRFDFFFFSTVFFVFFSGILSYFVTEIIIMLYSFSYVCLYTLTYDSNL